MRRIVIGAVIIMVSILLYLVLHRPDPQDCQPPQLARMTLAKPCFVQP